MKMPCTTTVSVFTSIPSKNSINRTAPLSFVVDLFRKLLVEDESRVVSPTHGRPSEVLSDVHVTDTCKWNLKLGLVQCLASVIAFPTQK